MGTLDTVESEDIGKGQTEEGTGQPADASQLDSVSNAVADVAALASTTVLEPEVFSKMLTWLKETPLSKIVEDAQARIGVAAPGFLDDHGIDLSHLEARLRSKYGEGWASREHGLKVWISTLAAALEAKAKKDGGERRGNKRENEREITTAVSRIKEILG